MRGKYNTILSSQTDLHSKELKIIEEYLKKFCVLIKKISRNAKNRKRIAIFSPSKYGLGHFHHCDILNQKLNEIYSGQIISLHITDLLPSKEVPPNTIKIPNYSDIIWTKNVSLNGKSVQLNEKQMSIIRKKMIDNFFKTFKPSLVMIDHYPFIHSNKIFKEFYEALEVWKKENNDGKLISLYRGILGFNPEKNPPGYKERIKNTIINQIDLVLVLADLDERFFLREELWFLKEEFHKFQYMGYLTEMDYFNNEKSKKIVCQAGGGVDGEKLIRVFCESMGILMQFDDKLSGLIIFGPTFPLNKKKDILENFIELQNLNFSNGIPNLTPILNESNLIISMGGYNSIIQAANLDSPAIIVPREKELKHEQFLNAIRFFQYGLIDEVIEMERLSVKTLIPAIIRQLYKKNMKDINMNGLQNTINEISKLLGIDRK